MSASGQVEMSAFGDVASPERRTGGSGAGRDEQQGAGPSRSRSASSRGTAHPSEAGEFVGLSERQVRRLCAAFEERGPAGLVSASAASRAIDACPTSCARGVEIVRDRYLDFGPTLACEKLLELHALRVSKERLRAAPARVPWRAGADRRVRARLVRERGPVCSLLVYVDDATGRLMELRFVEVESAFDYFASTSGYLRRHGKPVAFYSDKHSIFRVNHEGSTGRVRGVTQFGRALTELNFEIICANSPQAKGRVERMNKTLQDRLVKELRLRTVSTMEAGNAFLPEFMEDYNRRFGCTPKNPHDAHGRCGATRTSPASSPGRRSGRCRAIWSSTSSE